MKIDVNEQAIGRVCDAALRSSGLGIFQEVTIVMNALLVSKANSQNELAEKSLESGKEKKDAPKANDASVAE